MLIFATCGHKDIRRLFREGKTTRCKSNIALEAVLVRWFTYSKRFLIANCFGLPEGYSLLSQHYPLIISLPISLNYQFHCNKPKEYPQQQESSGRRSQTVIPYKRGSFCFINETARLLTWSPSVLLPSECHGLSCQPSTRYPLRISPFAMENHHL